MRTKRAEVLMEDSKKGPDRVLAIAAHPDDEVLGCGGTLALHAQHGRRVAVLIACEGESVRYAPGEVDLENDMRRAARALGVGEVKLLGFEDQKLDTLSLVEIIRPIEAFIRRFRPNIVYCQYGGDLNRDHQILFQAIMVAVRPAAESIHAIYAFDTSSSTEWAYPRSFVPDTWIDVSTTLEKKLQAMECYQSELRPYPHPRSIEALRNKARSCGNQVCLDAAEAFVTVRRICRNGQAAA